MQALDVLGSCELPLELGCREVLHGSDGLEQPVGGTQSLSQVATQPWSTHPESTLGTEVTLHFLKLEWQLALLELTSNYVSSTLMNLSEPGSMAFPSQGKLWVNDLLLEDFEHAVIWHT